MSEKCKVCKEKFNSGIWLTPQFKEEKVFLFCSDKCKNKHIKEKLERIKMKYPNYYNKLLKTKGNDTIFFEVLK